MFRNACSDFDGGHDLNVAVLPFAQILFCFSRSGLRETTLDANKILFLGGRYVAIEGGFPSSAFSCFAIHSMKTTTTTDILFNRSHNPPALDMINTCDGFRAWDKAGG